MRGREVGRTEFLKSRLKLRLNKSSVDVAALLSAVSVTVFWGLSFVAARFVLVTVGPLVLATLRFMIASAILAPILAMKLDRSDMIKARDLPILLLLGLLGVTFFYWAQYVGVKYTGAGIGSLLVVGLIPSFTGVLSSILLMEKFTGQRLLGLALGFVGVALIVFQHKVDGVPEDMFLLGVVSLVSNAISWALYSTISRRLMRRRHSPLGLTVYVSFIGTIALIPLSMTADWSEIWALTPSQWAAIFYLSFICTVVGYFLWNFALSKMEAVKTTVWLYLEPPVAIVGAAVLINEAISSYTLAAGVIILLGAYITTRSQ